MVFGLPVFLLMFFVPIAIVGVAVFFAWRHDKKRDAEFLTAAFHLGWTMEEGVAAPPPEIEGFHLFGLGYSRKTKNVHKGRPGSFDASLFDFRYTTGGGRNSKTHRQTVMALHLPESTLPTFELRPENVFHRIGEAFGYQDIDLEQYPAFSKSYLLRGPDPAEIRETFSGEIVDYLERNGGWAINGGGSWIVVYRPGRRVKPDELSVFGRDCDRIASALVRR